MTYITTREQTTDILVKGLRKASIKDFASKMGMIDNVDPF